MVEGENQLLTFDFHSCTVTLTQPLPHLSHRSKQNVVIKKKKPSEEMEVTRSVKRPVDSDLPEEVSMTGKADLIEYKLSACECVSACVCLCECVSACVSM